MTSDKEAQTVFTRNFAALAFWADWLGSLLKFWEGPDWQPKHIKGP